MKKTISILSITAIVAFLAISAIVALLLFSGCQKKEYPVKEMYLASDSTTVTIYSKNEDGTLSPSGSRFRGEKVAIQGETIVQDELNYEPCTEGEDTIYYLQTDLVESYEECVRETDKYVRTSITTYLNSDDCSIAGFIKKGAHLQIAGFDNMVNGEVNMYRIKDDAGNEGWAFSKYLVDSQEEANAINTEYYELNKDKVYSFDLYGGSPATLDYFPYESDVASDKEMPTECRTYYIAAGAIDAIDTYIDICKTANANAVVVDIKDGGLAYHAEVAQQYSPTSYARSYHDNAVYKAAIEKLKAEGIWTIGRIVVFNDSLFAEDNPDECIYNYGENQGWPSAYSRKAWEYNVKLAISAVEEMGFDEIQFDYVRFPENSYGMSNEGAADFKNTYGEEKAEAIQNFCFYAADQIHKAGAYFSVDVFGECSDGYVTAYGQYWPAISNVVDAISSMPYVDHFGRDVDTWSDSYTTMYTWATKAAQAQTLTPTPAIPRTWLTCYAVPYWDPQIWVSADFLASQIQALWDAGIGYGGFITWNAGSDIDIYYSVAPAFQRQYQ